MVCRYEDAKRRRCAEVARTWNGYCVSHAATIYSSTTPADHNLWTPATPISESIAHSEPQLAPASSDAA